MTTPNQSAFADEFAKNLFALYGAIAGYIASNDFEQATRAAESLAMALRRLMNLKKQQDGQHGQ
jgi:hypothetical protein